MQCDFCSNYSLLEGVSFWTFLTEVTYFLVCKGASLKLSRSLFRMTIILSICSHATHIRLAVIQCCIAALLEGVSFWKEVCPVILNFYF